MQRYFVGAYPRSASPVVPLLDNVAGILCAARDLGMPVVYTRQPGRMTRAQRGLLYDFWGAGMSVDPVVREIVPEVSPRPGDVVVDKRRYSAFYETRLGEVLRDAGRDQLVVCGIYAHIGCLMTACDAYTRDVQPFLVADAVADFSPGHHRMALDYAARTCAVVVTTEELLAALRRPAVLVGHDARQLDPGADAQFVEDLA
jgi:bifunctional isochorismate lyase/aryl carrier protein